MKKPNLSLLPILTLFTVGALYGLGSMFSTTTPAQAPESVLPENTPFVIATTATRGDTPKLTPSLPVAQAAWPKRVPDTSSMAEEFNRATRLRAFFFDAIKSPERGGIFYGLAALGACKEYGGSSPLAASATHAQQDAFRQMTLRCEMTDEERHAALSQLAYNSGTGATTTLRDPLFQRISDLVGSKTDDERRHAIGRLLETQDAAVLISLFSDVGFGDASEIPFKGKWYRGEKGDQTIQMAVLLARCRLGTSCGPDSTEYLKLCAERGWCAGNVSDSIAQSIGALGIDAAATRDLAKHIVTTFTQQDASAFMAVP